MKGHNENEFSTHNIRLGLLSKGASIQLKQYNLNKNSGKTIFTHFSDNSIILRSYICSNSSNNRLLPIQASSLFKRTMT